MPQLNLSLIAAAGLRPADSRGRLSPHFYLYMFVDIMFVDY